MGRSPDKNIKKINLKHALDLDRKGLLNRQYNLPPHKDTIAVPNNGYVVIRLKADNPGELNRLFCNILQFYDTSLNGVTALMIILLNRQVNVA